MASRFPLAQHPRITVASIGVEQEPLLIVDAIVSRPEHLIEAAAASSFAPAFGPAGGYPGLRAPAPSDYVTSVVRALAGPIADEFGLGPVRPTEAKCSFSLVTLPADGLVPPQRAPHVDTVDPWQFAILHYLCPPEFGGTAFFRHRATGFETLSEQRLPIYRRARESEGWSDGYVDDGQPWFERTADVPATFNSLVVYRSRVLHSGQIRAPERLSADPRRGRLTANIFATFTPS
jgi:hypothetical protein